MITQDLNYGKEEGYIRYYTPTVYYMPSNNIYNILDVKSGDAFVYAPATFANKVPLVFKFRNMQVGDDIRFVFYANDSPIPEGSKLPVLSMKIDGAETLLPSKIPQIKNVRTAYVDYKITQNMNDVKISLFVRNDISSNGTTILQEPPNVCTEGLIYIDVKRDIEPPTFNTINTSIVTASSVNLNINCSENATAYYKLYDRGATAPTPAELKAAHDNTISLTANNLITKNITGLTALKDYDLYVVAEDTVGNLQALPTKINFSTISNIVKGTPNEGANGTLGNGLLAHYSFNDGSLADISGNGYDLTQIGIINNTTDKDDKINQAKENTASSYLTSSPKSLTGGTDNAISMWVYLSNLSYGGGIIFSIGDSPNSSVPNIAIRQYYTTIMVYAGGEYSSYLDITTGWHNIVYNKNKLYIDKQLKTIHNPFVINAFLYLFAGYQGFDPGKLDEIRIYNRALTGDATAIGDIVTGEIAEIFDMGVNYANNDNTYKISEIKFNIDFDKTQLGTSIDVKYSGIKSSGGSILYKDPIVKYWTNSDKTVRVFDKAGETFGESTDLYFQIECDGYEPSDVIHKELKKITVSGYNGGYNGGLTGYAKYDNDNYKKSEARILIPLTNTSFISYKK